MALKVTSSANTFQTKRKASRKPQKTQKTKGHLQKPSEKPRENPKKPKKTRCFCEMSEGSTESDRRDLAKTFCFFWFF